MGEVEVEFKDQKSLIKSVKNISVLIVAFSKSEHVLIKNACNRQISGLQNFEAKQEHTSILTLNYLVRDPLIKL